MHPTLFHCIIFFFHSKLQLSLLQLLHFSKIATFYLHFCSILLKPTVQFMAQETVTKHRLEESVRQTTLPLPGAAVNANVSNSSSSSMSNSSSCPASQGSSSSVSKSTLPLRVERNASASSSSSSTFAVSNSSGGSQPEGPPITMDAAAYTYSKQQTPVSQSASPRAAHLQAKSSSSPPNVAVSRWSVWKERSDLGHIVYFVGKGDSSPVQLSPQIALTVPALTRCGPVFHPVAPPSKCMSAFIFDSFYSHFGSRTFASLRVSAFAQRVALHFRIANRRIRSCNTIRKMDVQWTFVCKRTSRTFSC